MHVRTNHQVLPDPRIYAPSGGEPGRPDIRSQSLVLARKVAYACFRKKADAVTIYRIPRGWVSAVLRDDPQIEVIETHFGMNEFLLSPGTKTALIPLEFSLDVNALARMCGFCSVEKTIFFEVMEDES